MGDGRWRSEGRRSKLEGVRWKTEGGKMDEGRWRMEDGRQVRTWQVGGGTSPHAMLHPFSGYDKKTVPTVRLCGLT